MAELLHRLPATGVVVTDATYDMIARNPLAEALLGNLDAEPNLARRRFLHLNPWEVSGGEEFGHIAAARLRSVADRYPDDEPLARLLVELRTGSEDFSGPGHRLRQGHAAALRPRKAACARDPHDAAATYEHPAP